MIPQAKIELAKTRDFSLIIGDTFQFIQENFKPLIKCFFVFCGFFLVANFIFLFLQELNLMSALDNTLTNPNSYNTSSSPFANMFGWNYLLTLLSDFFTGTVMMVTVISYIAIYKAKGNQPATVEEVWGYLKYYIFRVFGTAIVLALLLVIAFVCCIIPCFWLYPIVGLIFPIMIIENAGLSFAFNQSFRIIKNNWWLTFGALLVIALIAGMMGGIVAIPATVLTFGSMFLHQNKGHVSPAFIAFYAASIEVCRLFYILPVVTLTICYFSLNEMKEGTGLMERINQMGNDTPSNDLPAEQY